MDAISSLISLRVLFVFYIFFGSLNGLFPLWCLLILNFAFYVRYFLQISVTPWLSIFKRSPKKLVAEVLKSSCLRNESVCVGFATNEIHRRVIRYFVGLPQQSVSALVFYCNGNKLPQTWLLKATQIYYLTVLEVKCLIPSCWAKIRLSAGLHSFLEPPGKSPFPSLFQVLEATCIP